MRIRSLAPLLGLLAACGTEDRPARSAAAPFPGKAAVLAGAPEAVRACAGCHAATVHRWLQNGMADTLGPIDPAAVPAPLASSWRPNPRSGYQYRVEERAGHWEIAQERAALPGLPEHRRTQRLAWRIGAGLADMSFVARESERWYFAPLEYFTAHGWELAPSEQRVPPQGLGRPITAQCLECHTTEPLPAVFPHNRLAGLEPRGMDCAACHGPGEEHARRMLADPAAEDLAILHPGRLPPRRQLDICARCHLQGDARIDLAPGRPFQPGEDLFARRAVLVAAHPTDDFGFVSQTGRMALSACFQASPEMSCTTCHDAHLPARLQPRAELLAACTGCHPAPHAAASVDPGSRDCIDCHMRRSQPFDLEHVAVHDHWIRSEPPPPEILPAIRERETRDGQLALFAYAPGAGPAFSAQEAAALEALGLMAIGESARALALFEELPREAAPDQPVLRLPQLPFTRGRALEEAGRLEEAGAAYRQALELDPDLAEARINLAWVLARSSRPAAARIQATAAARAFPHAATPYNVLAFVAEQEGRPEEVARALQESLQRFPQQPAVWRTLAQVQARAGDPAAALDSLSRAYFLDPDLPGLALELAQAAARLR